MRQNPLPVAPDEIQPQYEAAVVKHQDPAFWQEQKLDWGMLAAAALAGYVAGLLLSRR
jgi:hypothetical protein